MAKIPAAQVKELREKTGVGMMDAKKALVETDGDMDAAIELLREKGMGASDKRAHRIAAEGLSTIAIDGNKATIIEVNCETDFVAKTDDFKQLVEEIAKAINAAEPADLEEAGSAELDGQTISDAINEATNKIGEKITLRRFALLTKEDDQVFGPYIHGGNQISTVTLLNGGNEEVARDVSMHVSAIDPRYISREEVPAEDLAAEKEVLSKEALDEGKPENIVEKMVEGRLNKWLAEISLVDQEFVKNPDLTVAQYLEENKAEVVNYTRFEVGEGIEKRVENLADEVAKELNN
ncbi:MAG: translation elongation factor Ts [Atopococcus tabaci]|uniref:Elongation factor Ts n=1 Tax=Atopococcus tabaci TaxID=269774 RepID=A0AA43RJP2_9LACT|nr:translation elongation factor Ts [Atopococcus tabaci]